jgi:hypothetical protein
VLAHAPPCTLFAPATRVTPPPRGVPPPPPFLVMHIIHIIIACSECTVDVICKHNFTQIWYTKSFEEDVLIRFRKLGGTHRILKFNLNLAKTEAKFKGNAQEAFTFHEGRENLQQIVSTSSHKLFTWIPIVHSNFCFSEKT